MHVNSVLVLSRFWELSVVSAAFPSQPGLSSLALTPWPLCDPGSSFTPLILGPQTIRRALWSVSDRPLPRPWAPAGEEGLSQDRAASASWPCLWGKAGDPVQFWACCLHGRPLRSEELEGAGPVGTLHGEAPRPVIWEEDFRSVGSMLNAAGQVEVISGVSSGAGGKGVEREGLRA